MNMQVEMTEVKGALQRLEKLVKLNPCRQYCKL
jgi:hypothetical protein